MLYYVIPTGFFFSFVLFAFCLCLCLCWCAHTLLLNECALSFESPWGVMDSYRKLRLRWNMSATLDFRSIALKLACFLILSFLFSYVFLFLNGFVLRLLPLLVTCFQQVLFAFRFRTWFRWVFCVQLFFQLLPVVHAFPHGFSFFFFFFFFNIYII